MQIKSEIHNVVIILEQQNILFYTVTVYSIEEEKVSIFYILR